MIQAIMGGLALFLLIVGVRDHLRRKRREGGDRKQQG